MPILPLVFALVLTTIAQTDTGEIHDGHIYENRTLGMSIELPGEKWQFFDKDSQLRMGLNPTHPSPHSSACRRAYCDEDVDTALISAPDVSPIGTIFLIAFRLAPEYLDATKTPLIRFAKGMMSGSLGQSGLKPAGSLELIHFGNIAAYRLITTNAKGAKVIGYVARNRGHVFLMTVSPLPTPESTAMIQKAVEAMQLQ